MNFVPRTLLLLFGLTLPARAQEQTQPQDQVLELRELLSQVERTHPLVQQAEAQVDEAEAISLSTQGAFDLKVEAQGSFSPLGKYGKPRGIVGLKQPTRLAGIQLWTRYDNGANFASYDGKSVTSEGGSWSAGLLMPLLQGRAIDPARLKRYVAEQEAEISREQQRQTHARLLSSAAQAWWSWVVAGKKLEAYRDLVRQAELRQTLLKEQIASGDVPPIEMEDNNRVLAQRQASLIKIEIAFMEKSLELGLFRRDGQGSPLAAEASELPPLPDHNKKAPATVDQRNLNLERIPQMQVYRIALQILEREIRGEGNRTLPKLNLEIYGAQSFGASRPYSEVDRSLTETSAGGKLSLAWDVQQRNARGKQASLRAKHRIVEQKQRFALERTKIQLRAQAYTLQAQFQVAQLSRQATEHARKVTEAERLSFQLGQSSVLAVNLREQALLSTYITELEATLALELAWLAQQELLGLNEPQDYLTPGG